MKKILYIIPMLLLFASCAKEQEQGPQNVQVPFNITIATKAGGSGSEVEPVIVNSVRVLIFNKQTATSTDPICIANEYYPFGFTTDLDEDNGTTLVKVNPTIYLESPMVKEYDVFVVLNEEGYTLTGGALLNDVLSDVELNSNESAFTAILATKAVYTATTEEPAMLMSAGQTVTYTSAETPIAVHFNATTSPSSALKRTMAMISVDKIVSNPSVDGTGTYDKELPKIFVLDASIENVPGGIDWDSTEDGAAGSDKVSLPLGEANADGYYDRVWEGSVYGDVAVKVKKVEQTNLRFYKTTLSLDELNKDVQFNKNGKKIDKSRELEVKVIDGDKSGWSFFPTDTAWFHVDPTTLGGVASGNDAIPGTHEFKSEEERQKYINNVYLVAKKYREEGHNAYNDMKNTLLPALFNDDCNISDCEYIIQKFDPDKKPTLTNLRCSEESWSIKLGETYYVPENISSAPSSATYIKVKLALSSPSLSLHTDEKTYGKDGVLKIEDMPTPDTVNETGFTYDYGFYKNSNERDDVGKGQFAAHAHIVNRDDETIEYTSETDSDNNYHLYVDGFARYSKEEANATCVINQDFKKATFSWNIPLADGTDTHVYEFKIPVNNNLDNNGDYSIHRNTKYNVTLKVGSTTYGQLVTKSGEGEPALAVTATVTTEKINDNED